MAVTMLACYALLAWGLRPCGPGARDQRPSDKLDLAGDWQVIESLSDELPLLPGESMALARAAGTVRTGRPVRGFRGPDPQRVASVRTALRTALQASARLTIVRNGETLTLRDADGRVRPVVPDGQEVSLEADGLRFTLVARWKAPLLTVEREFEDGTTVSDSYATFTDPRQLVATSTIQNSRMDEKPVTLTRVYAPVDR
jgi:hypothetical protein